jgi:hypothetical protein
MARMSFQAAGLSVLAARSALVALSARSAAST